MHKNIVIKFLIVILLLLQALAWAASSGYGQIARLLIERGADVNICNNMGQSPVDLAYECGHNEVSLAYCFC